MLRRLAFHGSALAFAATPARALSNLDPLDPFGLDSQDVLAIYAALAILVAMLTWLLRDMARTTDRRPDLRDLDEVELAYCFGGHGHAADTLYVALASRGAACLDHEAIVVDGTIPGLPPQLDALSRALAGSHPRRRYPSAFAACQPYEALLKGLHRRKILLDPARRRRLALANRLPLAALLAFGLVEVAVGASRGQSVGPLSAFMAMSALLFGALFGRERYLTREALASLDAFRDSRSDALRASAPDELGFAFALLGPVALEGTALASPVENSNREIQASAIGDVHIS